MISLEEAMLISFVYVNVQQFRFIFKKQSYLLVMFYILFHVFLSALLAFESQFEHSFNIRSGSIHLT